MSQTSFYNQSASSQQEKCRVCLNQLPQFQALISHSLFGKYSSPQNYYYTKDIDDILNEELCHNFVQFQENNYLDDDEQYLRREYATEQFPKKMQMLSEYYKFHRDQPTWNDKGIEPMMVKYYNRVKDMDYKRIKSVLKRQQNISITTHKSFSSFDDSEFTKKSRYSTMLNQLNTVSNQSVDLLEICDKIGKALKKIKPEQFKGSYYSGQKKFEDFLKKQKKRKQIAKRKSETGTQHFGLKKFKFNQKLQTKNDQNGVKESKFVSNHPLHPRNSFKHKQLSIQKTAANQTASREEKSRRQKPPKTINHKSSRASFSKKSLRDNFISEITQPTYKQLSTINLGSISNINNLKTITQIYQTTSSRLQSNGESKKNIRPTSSSKMKHRSNSTHNLCADKISSDIIVNKKDKINGNKLLRTNSSKKIPTSTAKTSNINLFNPVGSSQKLGVKGRSMSNKMLRTKSVSKLSSNHIKINDKSNYSKGSKKVTSEIGEKKLQKGVHEKVVRSQRNSVIENMLEKKLELFKKKQGFV